MLQEGVEYKEDQIFLLLRWKLHHIIESRQNVCKIDFPSLIKIKIKTMSPIPSPTTKTRSFEAKSLGEKTTKKLMIGLFVRDEIFSFAHLKRKKIVADSHCSCNVLRYLETSYSQLP